MVLEEFRRLLEESGFQIVSAQLDSMLAPDLRNLEVPRASVYVIDAHAARQATGALLGNILDHNADRPPVGRRRQSERSRQLYAAAPGRKGHPELRGSARTASSRAAARRRRRILGAARRSSRALWIRF